MCSEMGYVSDAWHLTHLKYAFISSFKLRVQHYPSLSL